MCTWFCAREGLIVRQCARKGVPNYELWAGNVSPASRESPACFGLFIMQGVDGTEPCGFVCRIDPEDQADGYGKSQCQSCDIRCNDKAVIRESGTKDKQHKS